MCDKRTVLLSPPEKLNSYHSGVATATPNGTSFYTAGYIYDHETGLYCLQSRYYDPEMGRFLNADAFTSTGQGFVGNNMFAYCGNNPISNYDPAGNYYAKAEDRITTGCSGRGGVPASAVRPSPPNSGPQPNPETNGFIDFITNTDEHVVLDADIFSMYKGVPVIKLPIGTDAFSFGIIFLGDDVGKRGDAVETVQHEYGHAVHYNLIGPFAYAVSVFIPSVAGYHLGGDHYNANYYSYVYEYVADVFGGVNRTNYQYSSTTENWWGAYFLYTLLIP